MILRKGAQPDKTIGLLCNNNILFQYNMLLNIAGKLQDRRPEI